MKFLPRFIQAAAALTLAAAGSLACAQDYPNKPVRVLVGMAPGGSNDTIARMISSELTQTMSQPFVVENKPGANGIIATNELARATPDGHTLMLVISSHVTNTLLYPNLKFKLDDFAPVGVIADTPFLLVANPKFAPNNVSDLIGLVKGGTAVDFGSPGLGSTQHIAMELMDQMAGMKMNHIPYKGGAPAQTDVISGQIPLIFATPTQSLPFIREQKLKPIGVTSTQRIRQLPDVPTLAESGLPGYEASVWFGIIAPAGTPPAITERLSSEIARIVRSDKIRHNLDSMGLNPVGSTPVQFQKLLDEEQGKWAGVIQKSGIKVE